MQSSHSFQYLFFLVLLVENFIVVSALPLNQAAGLVTLPLRRFESRDAGLHPSIALQKRMNRNHKRLARMAGYPEPSTRELQESIQKRAVVLDEGYQSLAKRYSPKAKEVSDVKDIWLIGAPLPETDKPKGNELVISVDDAPLVTKGGPPTAQNSASLDIESADLGYLLTMTIGDQGKTFTFLTDSGSADVWVGSESCQSVNGGSCGKHNFLGKSSSNSFSASTRDFTINYSAGQVTGKVATDNFQIAGLKLNQFTFGSANTETNEFAADSTPFDGIVGLAKSQLSKINSVTIVDALKNSGAISKKIVSYKLSRLADGKNDGEISFGGLDPTKFDSSKIVSLDNVSRLGFWESAMDAITVDSKDLPNITGRTAIFDTGTTVISAPPADATALHTAIPGAKTDGQGGFTIPCHSTTPVSLRFGGQDFVIDSRDLIGPPVKGSNADGDCQSGIHSGRADGPPQWLLGDVFLKNVYLSTDDDGNKVTLAKLA